MYKNKSFNIPYFDLRRVKTICVYVCTHFIFEFPLEPRSIEIGPNFSNVGYTSSQRVPRLWRMPPSLHAVDDLQHPLMNNSLLGVVVGGPLQKIFRTFSILVPPF